MMFLRTRIAMIVPAGLLALGMSGPAFGQDNDSDRRTRVAAGVQIVPSYPGSDEVSLRPLFDLSRAGQGDPFVFEAPDESFGFGLFGNDRVSVGPAIGFEGKRSGGEVGTTLPEVGFTVEAGAFVDYRLSPALRLRGEVRRGLGGHDGWIGTVGADYVARQGDDWLVSLGPRLTLTDDNYQDAYFSVAPEDASAAGLPAYDADGGVQAVGAAGSFLKQFDRHWGIYTYAKYDRLVGDPGDSPIVRRFGSRNQVSGGVGLSYTFGE